MDETIKYGAVGLMAGVVLGIIIAPWFSQSENPRLNSMMDQNIDRHFIEEMLPHHEGAIAMAELALEQSKRPEILSLANGIIDAQERENKQMRKWYDDWFGGVPSSSSSMGGMIGHGGMGIHMGGMEGDLEALKSANDFDLEFISQMIPHHEMAVMMARMLAVSTNRAEMKTLADNIITSQSQEIEIMRNWYREWSK
jgi:uncharacterized protein (DUF305 family)